ncbi:aminotransferase class I/II-fold pyridoxal phosphate-dependent enzyme [Nonomuraea phyllanthi]|uniref:8-amino-7-oxononanoate synthase n=1 Tax=Nonomuraea phyllanthi TaxID=2219224 RepID=UPI001293B20B|nr:8-amino-7-oxononanoate synthase [Nonomuraea phyllanthi]QFY10270.1 aminotransferase class I/II-fold pyridoxal phosphate-dependent enzyme [Nonomuraea phyllanthi]
MRPNPFDWINAAADQRRSAGLARALRPRPADSALLDLASNDYLGLARHPDVARAAAEAARRWGAGATGSRLVTGTTELHAALEAELADFAGFEAALVFASGYAANLAAVTALTGPGVLIASDRHNHASLIDGCRLSRAETVVVPHADPAAAAKALEHHDGRAIVVTESVFSVDGDAMPLTDLAEAGREVGAAVIIDDAHGFGVLGTGGRGAAAAAGLAGAPDIVCTMTLSKALGSQGGAVLGPARVIDHLINTARTFIFDTGLAPAATAAGLAALRLLRRDPAHPSKARNTARELHARLTAAGLDTPRPEACVLSVRARNADTAVRWAAACRDAGIAVGCFRPPSVPDGISRLRLSARADLTPHDIDRAAHMIIRTVPR